MPMRFAVRVSMRRAPTRARQHIVLFDADCGRVRLDRLDLAGTVRMKRHEGETITHLREEVSIACLDRAFPMPGRFEHDVGKQRALRLQSGGEAGMEALVEGLRQIVDGAVGRHRAREQDRQVVVLPEPHIDLDEFGEEDRAHVIVEMGDVDAGCERPVDLRPKLGLDRLRMGVAAQLGHAAPEIAFVIDETGCSPPAGERAPAIMRLLGRQGEVDAEIEAGSRAAQSAISGNHGQGTITEPASQRPARLSSRKARLAPWHMPTSSTCSTMSGPARLSIISRPLRISC